MESPENASRKQPDQRSQRNQWNSQSSRTPTDSSHPRASRASRNEWKNGVRSDETPAAETDVEAGSTTHPSTEPFAPVSPPQQPASNPLVAPNPGVGPAANPVGSPAASLIASPAANLGPAPVFGPGMAPPPAAAQAMAQVQPPRKTSVILPIIVTFIVCLLLLAGGLFGYKKLTEPSDNEANPGKPSAAAGAAPDAGADEASDAEPVAEDSDSGSESDGSGESEEQFDAADLIPRMASMTVPDFSVLEDAERTDETSFPAVTLSDGVYGEPGYGFNIQLGSNDPSGDRGKISPIYAQGDLNGDGEDEIVVQMYSNQGGNSYVNHFVVYDKNLTPMGYTQVDDLDEDLPTMGRRGQTVDEVKVEDGKLFFDYLGYGDSDPMSSPSQRTQVYLTWNGGTDFELAEPPTFL